MIAWARGLAGLALALAACAPEPLRPDPDVVARLGDEPVRHADFEAHVRSAAGEAGAGLASEALSQLLDQYLTERLLARLAVERGLVEAGAEPAAAAEALLAAAPRPVPTGSEIAAWYSAHRAELARAERVELAQILTEDRLAAERARREILAGADFATVARRISADPSSGAAPARVFGREDLPPAFAEIVFALPAGGVSEVVAADYGFHVFQVVRRLPAQVPELDQVRDEVTARLVAERADQALARLVQDARSRYAVEVFDRNLPFIYRGAFPVARPYEKKS